MNLATLVALALLAMAFCAALALAVDKVWAALGRDEAALISDRLQRLCRTDVS